MLFRFSLYGFLKNQRYFEPFLVLALLDKGLSFFAIGGLVAFREICTNILEIPSGSIADLLGRRRVMLLAFLAYACSYVIFWLADDPLILWPAMAMFSVGEAFRTGTHKAMIFEWLRREGRTHEKTSVYGYTRSWSKIGSATSVAIGAALLFWLDQYAAVFLLSAVPALLNVINLASYPRDLDKERASAVGFGEVWRHSKAAISEAVKRRPLRRLLGESMAFEGVFHASKDYLQPLLATAAIAIFANSTKSSPFPTDGWSDLQRTTLLIAPVYLALYLLSAFASRRAHRVVEIHEGDEERAARSLWGAATMIFLAMLIGEWTATIAVTITAFVCLHVAQNLWRPILISRFANFGATASSAVTLSVESQARRCSTMILAPLFGWAIDASQVGETAHTGIYWPIGAFGLALAITMLFGNRHQRSPSI